MRLYELNATNVVNVRIAVFEHCVVVWAEEGVSKGLHVMSYLSRLRVRPGRLAR